MTDFAVHARRILAAARTEGLSFDDAWARVTTTIRPTDTAWGRLDCSEELLEETPMMHCRRVMQTAYGAPVASKGSSRRD